MADGRIEIDTKIDPSGVEKDSKKLKDIIAKIGSSGTVKGLANLGATVTGIGTAFKGVTGAAQTAVNVVKDLTDSYKTQKKAEIQLETASKNNPYLNSSNVKALKNYASELQGISTVGDEELIPFMASLATAGRTQEEIMDIMTVAVNMQATGMYSLDSAVKNLNKTYGGLSGELGETIPDVKNLTVEQLKNGDAVKLLGDKYKGMAEQTSKATGTSEQLKNAMGDLKEEIGAPFEKAMSPVRAYFTELISGWANAKKAKREWEETLEESKEAKGTEKDNSYLAQIRADEAQKEFEEQEKYFKKLDESWRNLKTKVSDTKNYFFGAFSEDYKNDVQQLKNLENDVVNAGEKWKQAKIKAIEAQAEVSAKKKEEDARAEEERLEAERLALEAERKAIEDKIQDHIKAVTAEREKQLEVLRLTAQAQGGQVSKQDELNAYMSSYIKLISESDGLISEGNSEAIKLMEKIKALSGEVAGELNTEKLENDYKDFLDKCKELSKKDMKESELMAEELSILETEYAKLTADQKKAIEEEYTNAHKALMDKQTEQAKAEAEAEVQAKKDALAENLSIANDFATQYAEITNSIVALASKQTDDEATIKTAEIEKQYADGIISQEEYEKKKAEIDKESAEKKYKLDMWAWSASILTATANTAMGVTKALAEGGVLGMVTGALVGVAGAVQLATIIANKPIKPSFATGGIVGGNSFYGDKVSANLNSGEMILNARQQQNMFKAIDRNTLGGGTGANIKIYNSASNDVSARPEITEDGIKILIRKTVSKDMNDGRFNSSMRTAQSSFSGNRFTS